MKIEKYDNRPIGVFDSGIGGLTVVKQLMAQLPCENLVYFGDTARIPYGTKSEEIIRRFALEDSFYLLDKAVKIIVVACNTASAIAVSMLKEIFNIPVTGVIQPGAEAAANLSRNGKIGIIGTAATIRSDNYKEEILRVGNDKQIISQACPLFVPLVEEGLIEDEATYLIARRYLQSIVENKVDTLVLGCTHYPLLVNVLQKIVGPNVRLIDSGVETTKTVKKILFENQLLADRNQVPFHRFYLSDMPYKFQDIAERFLQRSVSHIEIVDFESFLVEKGSRFWKKFHNFLVKSY
jgi:glutamate racemase